MRFCRRTRCYEVKRTKKFRTLWERVRTLSLKGSSFLNDKVCQFCSGFELFGRTNDTLVCAEIAATDEKGNNHDSAFERRKTAQRVRTPNGIGRGFDTTRPDRLACSRNKNGACKETRHESAHIRRTIENSNESDRNETKRGNLEVEGFESFDGNASHVDRDDVFAVGEASIGTTV